MDNSFFEALSSLGSEANVDTALLVEKVKSAMLKAARKAYPECEENISVEIDPATKTFEMYLRQTVVDDEPIDANEVNIDVARTIDPNACVGGFIERRLDIAKFGEQPHSLQSSPSRVICVRSTGNASWASSSPWKTTASPVRCLRSRPVAQRPAVSQDRTVSVPQRTDPGRSTERGTACQGLHHHHRQQAEKAHHQDLPCPQGTGKAPV